jgi:predicted GNAT family acetyltransferase
MAADEDLSVRHSPERSRYEAVLDGEVVGVADYHLHDGRMVLPHTEVVPDHEGKGIGGRLAQAALDGARDQGLLVVPSCWFIREYIDRNGGYADLVA